MTIEDKYQELLVKPSDINLCFPMIRGAVEKGDFVVELGVRNCVSTWALLAGKPSEIISVDVVQPKDDIINEVGQTAQKEGIDWSFCQADSTQIFFPAVDVLFIDTVHLYSHLVKELWRHSEVVKKRIILHDTKIPEVRSCVQDFLYNLHWDLEKENHDSNGLMVLKRVRPPLWQ